MCRCGLNLELVRGGIVPLYVTDSLPDDMGVGGGRADLGRGLQHVYRRGECLRWSSSVVFSQAVGMVS